MLLTGQPRPPPVVDLGPPHPLPQRLGRADPQLLRDRGDRGPLRRVVRRDLGDHAHRSLPQLQRVLARSPHSSILLKRWNGVSRLSRSLIAGFWCADTRRPVWADGVTRQSSVARLSILLSRVAASLRWHATWGSVSSRSPCGGVRTASIRGWSQV